MRPLHRKLTFQLTPLLDLLLIVIFAQYLEVAHTTQEQVDAVRARAEQQVSSLQQEHEQAVSRSESAEQEKTRLQAELGELQKDFDKQIRELTEALKNALKREEQVGDIVAELFQVPENLVSEALEPDRVNERIRSPEEVRKLRAAFRELAAKRGREVVKHLLTYEELRKRCDIWELYIEEDGSVLFHTGNNTFSFRADSPEAFADIMFQRYKSVPQPKSLVIMLLSYADARAGPRHAALNGLPLAAAQMRSDAGGRSRFEYAVLGFNPTPPAFLNQ